MNRKRVCVFHIAVLIVSTLFLQLTFAHAQSDRPGHPIGKISTEGNLIVMELNEGALGKANLFDLAGRTLRFTPEGSGYRVENAALQWDPEFGPELTGADVTLHNFAFPFSGKNWNSLLVGTTGSISFGEGSERSEGFEGPGPRGRVAGVSIGRFDPLGEAAGTLVNTVPAICVFFKPRTSGPHYFKELADRVVITWDLTEPFGNIQDFTWYKTINRFQAVLHRNGAIEFSYNQVTAKDAIVGVYPMLSGEEKPLATITASTISAAEPHPAAAANLDIRNLKISVIDGLLLKVTFETRGPVPPDGDPAVRGVAYRVFFDKDPSASEDSAHPSEDHSPLVWTIRGFGRRGRPTRYVAFGEGVSRGVNTSGNTITMQGILPVSMRGAKQLTVHAESATSANPDSDDSEKIAAQVPPQVVHLSGVRNAEVHLSSLTRKDGPFPVVYESFHYLDLPRPEDLACTVIKTLGDKFDFLAYYSDFRVDNQEAGTPSDGPVGGEVTGIGQTQHDLESYCSQGRFQWGFVQPVYVGSNQMQERPPEDAPVAGDHDITFYLHQLSEISADGKILPYNYAMSQIGHEMGHRWAAFVSAKVNGETIPLGPVHWARGLQARVAFPYQRPTEASAMGGGVWQDNFDGTYTQLDDDYYVPATGYSYLDLYLMGLISPAEVPDFFILKNLVPAGKDANGHPIFKADRTKVTIQDVIASEGPRVPDVDHSQRKFNTGIVVVVEHGRKPSAELIERANGIRRQWIQYWATTTGHRASMTAIPQ